MMDDNATMMNSDSTMMGNDSTMMGNNTKMMKNNPTMYACPMHPEVQGKLNDKCPKCGMKLTVPVPKTAEKSNK
ncbi:heavy metal-binding domain-containing protein [Flavobacterium sp. GB2R13]|uniref:heavy metal-binding domain-containing protein n=1 Tax=Flavobacterium algoris TaxID=3398733 RepID=UPI003A83B7A3